MGSLNGKGRGQSPLKINSQCAEAQDKPTRHQIKAAQTLVHKSNPTDHEQVSGEPNPSHDAVGSTTGKGPGIHDTAE